MDESILDRVLTELSKNGTDKIEATDEVMERMNLKKASQFHSNEIAFLIKQGYVFRETTSHYSDPNGEFHPARYFLNLTPEGLKFITEGGYTAKSEYSKKTLTVATQSRNWAIAAVGIALVALFIQVYYGSCSNSVNKTSTKQPNIPNYKDSIQQTRPKKDSV